jgi:DNA-binding CsgD family transcriptional regulator
MRQYDEKAVLGQNSLARSGDRVIASARRSDGTGLVTYSASAASAPEMIFDGAYNYLGSDQAGAGRIFSIIGHDRRVVQGELVSVEISEDAAPGVRALTPTSLNWAVYHEHIDYIMGVPRVLGTQDEVLNADAANGLLLALFDNSKRPSIIIDGTDVVRYRNEAADRLLGRHFEQGRRFVPDAAAERAAFAKAVRDLAAGHRFSDPMTFDTGLSEPIIAHAAALDPRIAGDRALMMTFLEPSTAQKNDVSAVLRLLGLTAAEARLGSLIGTGITSRAAARELGITENTARSTMKVVFDKLRIGKQSELARIVARLELL